MSRRIVILGAGVGGAQVLKYLHKKFHHDANFSFSVVDRQNFSSFAPMLHEVATGSVSPTHVTHPIRQILHCCLETFHQGEITGIDLKNKVVSTNKEQIDYDYLVVALGSTNNFYNLPGVGEHTFQLKTMADAVKLRAQIIDTFEQATGMARDEKRAQALHFVVVGGGYTGVETAGQMAELFRKDFRRLYNEIYPEEPRITLIQGGERILPILSEQSSKKAENKFKKLGIHLKLGSRVAKVTKDGVELENGELISAKTVIWASGVKAVGADYFPDEMLDKGRVKVNDTLQIPDYPNVYVVGDLSSVIQGGPHPQTAQAAFEQAKLCSENISRSVNDLPLLKFVYKHKGDLVPIGDRWAVAEIGPFKFSGFFAWWLRRTVYLKGLFSWNDRIRVVFDWTINLFSKRDTTRL